MKQLFTILIAGLITVSAFAQAPEKMSYQAVIRDANSLLVTNQTIGIQISILQGSATGTAIYVETQAPSTNINGLVSIEIGNGIVVSGIFNTIDWANDSYFVKTEIDPTGGTNYTIIGTSQLLSVPYALHSKTAEALSSPLIETDPIFVASPSSSITNTDISNWNIDNVNDADSDPVNEIQTISRTGTIITLSNGGGTFQDSVRNYIAGNGIVITNNTIIAMPSNGHYIGESYQGGIIFYVNSYGNHGLILALTDQGSAENWYNAPNTISDMTNYGLNGQSQSGWRLPTRHELNLMYLTRSSTVQTTAYDFINGIYWSSSESIYTNGYTQHLITGAISSPSKTNSYNIRAIHEF
jgi:hypothetical protein